MARRLTWTLAGTDGGESGGGVGRSPRAPRAAAMSSWEHPSEQEKAGGSSERLRVRVGRRLSQAGQWSRAAGRRQEQPGRRHLRALLRELQLAAMDVLRG